MSSAAAGSRNRVHTYAYTSSRLERYRDSNRSHEVPPGGEAGVARISIYTLTTNGSAIRHVSIILHPVSRARLMGMALLAVLVAVAAPAAAASPAGQGPTPAQIEKAVSAAEHSQN